MKERSDFIAYFSRVLPIVYSLFNPGQWEDGFAQKASFFSGRSKATSIASYSYSIWPSEGMTFVGCRYAAAAATASSYFAHSLAGTLARWLAGWLAGWAPAGLGHGLAG